MIANFTREVRRAGAEVFVQDAGAGGPVLALVARAQFFLPAFLHIDVLLGVADETQGRPVNLNLGDDRNQESIQKQDLGGR